MRKEGRIVGIKSGKKFTIAFFVVKTPAIRIAIKDALGQSKPEKARSLIAPRVIIPTRSFVKRESKSQASRLGFHKIPELKIVGGDFDSDLRGN